MMTDPPRRRLPRWVSTLVVVAVAVMFLSPGPWRGLEKVGSTVLAPIQMGVSDTVDEASHVVQTVQRVRELGAENADYKDEVAPAYHDALIRGATIEAIVGVAGGDFDLFGHALADEQIVFLACVLGDIHVHLVAGNTNRARHDDSAQGNDRDFRCTTADIDDHAAGRFGDR